MPDTAFDVIVVGAGVSGLASAHEVVKNVPNAKLVVLEANGRLGGRLCPGELKGPDETTGHFDLGGHWIARTQPHATMAVKELGLEVLWQDFKGGKILISGDSPPKIYENSQTGGLSFVTAIDLQLMLRQVQKSQELFSKTDLPNCAYAREYDGATLESFKQHSLMTKDGKAAFDVIVRSFLGADPCEMSYLYFLHYIRQSGGLSQLTDSMKPGNAQEQHIKGGAYQIINCLADRIGRENIKLNSVVTSVLQTDDEAVVKLENGLELKTKYVINSAPVHLKARMQYEPPLPRQQAALFERMPIGNMLKFIATYERKFWKDRGLSGEAAYVSIQSSEIWPVDFTMDASTAEGVPALVGFVCGPKSRKFSRLTDQEKKEKIVNSLVRFFGEAAAQMVDFAMKDWSEEPFVGGCPVGIASPGTYTMCDEENLRRPFGRIHWAGTETATLWKGYIDGAIQSGWRAAYEILPGLKEGFIPPVMYTENDIVLKEELRKGSIFASFRRRRPEKQS